MLDMRVYDTAVSSLSIASSPFSVTKRNFDVAVPSRSAKSMEATTTKAILRRLRQRILLYKTVSGSDSIGKWEIKHGSYQRCTLQSVLPRALNALGTYLHN